LLREVHLFSIRCKRRQRAILAVGQQNLDALFGLLQSGLLARQLRRAAQIR
jgi:hypothetical protein